MPLSILSIYLALFLTPRSSQLLESERSELSEIRRKGEEERVELINKTRIEGTEALDRATALEKERIRKRREEKVNFLRASLQSKVMSDLSELQSALDSDLETASNLMITR